MAALFFCVELCFLSPLYLLSPLLYFVVAALFCCRWFIYLFIYFFTPLSFFVTALLFPHGFILLSPLYFLSLLYLLSPLFCCCLNGKRNIKRRRKKSVRKLRQMLQRWSLNDEVNKVYKHDIDFKIEQTRNTNKERWKTSFSKEQ